MARPHPRPGSASRPVPSHAEFEWSKAAVSIVLVLAGIAVSGAVCWAFYGKRHPRLVGLTDRSRLAAAGYGFLINKYYLDFLYERGVVAGISGPVAELLARTGSTSTSSTASSTVSARVR